MPEHPDGVAWATSRAAELRRLVEDTSRRASRVPREKNEIKCRVMPTFAKRGSKKENLCMQTEPLETSGIICFNSPAAAAVVLPRTATLQRRRTPGLLVHAYICCPGDGRPSCPQRFPNQLLADPVATSVSLERKRCLLSCGTLYSATSSVAIADQQQREGWSCRNGAAAAAAAPSVLAWTSTTLRAGVYLALVVVVLLPRVSPDRAEARQFWR